MLILSLCTVLLKHMIWSIYIGKIHISGLCIAYLWLENFSDKSQGWVPHRRKTLQGVQMMSHITLYIGKCPMFTSTQKLWEKLFASGTRNWQTFHNIAAVKRTPLRGSGPGKQDMRRVSINWSHSLLLLFSPLYIIRLSMLAARCREQESNNI